ncbi:anthrone oxygenase family protein [Ammonicoccus fulvus]|uniref:Anthrone oxygenase family protein n=1 Tax=Ammonicoccus fulvus TaxID=3138240 RepID=A0ABZ3FLQ8_9ACTN
MSLTMSLVAGAGAVGSAIAGGVYANFSARIMPRLARLPEADGITRMQQFNRVALRPPFMTAFFGAAAASAATVITTLVRGERAPGDWLGLVGGACYLGGWLLTMAYNVPRNVALERAVPGTSEASRAWSAYLREWTAANTVRAGLSVVGALLLGAAAVAGLAQPSES